MAAEIFFDGEFHQFLLVAGGSEGGAFVDGEADDETGADQEGQAPAPGDELVPEELGDTEELEADAGGAPIWGNAP